MMPLGPRAVVVAVLLLAVAASTQAACTDRSVATGAAPATTPASPPPAGSPPPGAITGETQAPDASAEPAPTGEAGPATPLPDQAVAAEDDGSAGTQTGPIVAPAGTPVPGAPAAGRLPGEPDPALTPGAFNPAVTQATIGSTICVSGWTATVRPPSSYTTNLKIQQIGDYRYADTSTTSYEEDHLIPLQLGGAPSDPHNIWPEPYTAALSDGRNVGARVKDTFETSLKRAVCAGSMSLAEARARIGVHWVHFFYGIPLATGAAPAPTPTAPKPAPAATTPGATAKPAAGPLSVTFTSLTSPIVRGAPATAAVRTRAGAACTIRVVYKSGPSTAAGLSTKSASSSGRASWTWTVGSRTTPGSWPVTVTCSAGGASATATRLLVVRLP
jgi:hypothetical protein